MKKYALLLIVLFALSCNRRTLTICDDIENYPGIISLKGSHLTLSDVISDRDAGNLDIKESYHHMNWNIESDMMLSIDPFCYQTVDSIIAEENSNIVNMILSNSTFTIDVNDTISNSLKPE